MENGKSERTNSSSKRRVGKRVKALRACEKRRMKQWGQPDISRRKYTP